MDENERIDFPEVPNFIKGIERCGQVRLGDIKCLGFLRDANVKGEIVFRNEESTYTREVYLLIQDKYDDIGLLIFYKEKGRLVYSGETPGFEKRITGNRFFDVIHHDLEYDLLHEERVDPHTNIPFP